MTSEWHDLDREPDDKRVPLIWGKVQAKQRAFYEHLTQTRDEPEIAYRDPYPEEGE